MLRQKGPLGSFSKALMVGTAHPEVTLLVTSSLVPTGQLLSYEADVSVLRNGDEVYSAVWMNLISFRVLEVALHARLAHPAQLHPAAAQAQGDVISIITTVTS